MGSGGVREGCQSTLCILAAITLGLCLLCLLSGSVLYGVSRTFTAISTTHLVNRTTASNFTKGIDDKLDDMRSGSAEKGIVLMERANQLFYAAGAFGIATATLLVLSCVAGYKSRPRMAPPITAAPHAPAPAVPAPPPPPGEGTEGGATAPVPLGSPPMSPESPSPSDPRAATLTE